MTGGILLDISAEQEGFRIGAPAETRWQHS